MALHRFFIASTLLLLVTGCMEAPAANQVQVNVVVPPPAAAPRAQAPAQAAAPKPAQQTLSVLRITDGTGCPTRDPSSFGVFLKSERQATALVCYYD